MTSERLLNMSIKFYTSQKFYTPKQISGYAPAIHNDGTIFNEIIWFT